MEANLFKLPSWMHNQNVIISLLNPPCIYHCKGAIWQDNPCMVVICVKGDVSM